MYILDFLKEFSNLQKIEDTVSFEYRLLCSGELYNNRVITTDWRKSEAARIIFDSPFRLIICSHPFHDFPQELALQFFAPLVNEKQGQSVSMFYPDEDIARDFSALLTLFCRRLITVAAKIRESYPKQHPNEPPFFQDWPIGFVKSLVPVHWEYKPSVIINGPVGISEIINYNPPSLGIDPVNLKRLLLNISHQPFAESLVLSARLYSLALQQLEQDIDIAYQLLIAAVETMANDALKTYRPTDRQMITVKKSVATLAKKYGMSEKQADLLAIEACNGIPWASRKFTKFIVDNITDDLWKEDDLFELPTTILPEKEDFESAINTIYSARGKLTHGGHSFPLSSAIGVGPTASSRAFMSFDWSSKPFPPIVWFERVVSNALNGFIERSIQPGFDEESENTKPCAT